MQDTNTSAGKMEATLAERGSRYGSWRLQSQVTQNIKRTFADTPNWLKLPDYFREGLDQIANKLARVLSGDWTHLDNIHDTVGYARLIEECLESDIAGGAVQPVVLFDPDNPPVDLMIKLLSDRGYLINHPEEDEDEHPTRSVEDVPGPSFLRVPVRDTLAGDNESGQEQS